MKFTYVVTFTVIADEDFEAEGTLEYALDHSPLLSPENGISYDGSHEWSTT